MSISCFVVIVEITTFKIEISHDRMLSACLVILNLIYSYHMLLVFLLVNLNY